jgi:hypothetical protein
LLGRLLRRRACGLGIAVCRDGAFGRSAFSHCLWRTWGGGLVLTGVLAAGRTPWPAPLLATAARSPHFDEFRLTGRGGCR